MFDHTHVLFLFFMIEFFALHGSLQQSLVLLAKHLDLTEKMMVFLFQVSFQTG